MSMTIRRAGPADEGVLVAYNAALAWESEEKRLDEDVLREGVRAVLSDPTKGFYTLAELDGEIVGQTMITFEWSDWRNGWFWWVQSVYVREESRRAGVFRALFHHIQTEAEADPNVIGLRLYVERENGRAKTTYRALGMVDTPYEILEIYPLTRRTDDIG